MEVCKRYTGEKPQFPMAKAVQFEQQNNTVFHYNPKYKINMHASTLI